MPAGPSTPPLSISIVIPTFNEGGYIGRLLDHLGRLCATDAAVEIVVADGGSTDGTVAEVTARGARLVPCPRRGRAAQLNHGAARATGAILYFLHADTYPPATLLPDLRQAVAAGYGSGCYRLRFDEFHWFLQANAWFTRFNVEAVRFGDQSLFARAELFRRAGGYREHMLVFEDQEIIRRLRQQGQFRVLSKYVVTSARKYRKKGVYRLQSVFLLLNVLYRLGLSQTRLASLYRRFVRSDKL